MQATLREMGVTFDFIRDSPWGQHPWMCDLLPHIFPNDEWQTITEGFRQRLRAFEFFLQDVYGLKTILREGIIPIHPVLRSSQYHGAITNIPRPENIFLHLCGLCITRNRSTGQMEVKHHQFGHAPGISYMMQNRRALARIMPELFEDIPVESLATTPLAIIEKLRESAPGHAAEPTVVLLTPGAGSEKYSQHSLLARRMGIPLVQGGDLLVLDDCVYLKTVKGLQRVEVIYNRLADRWLDPLVFDRSSLIGIPGLVHCLRKGTVTLVNAVGSQLADDRSLLGFSARIIRYYLGEKPILPSVATYWLGDIDQRELVLDNPKAYNILPVYGDVEQDPPALPSRLADLRELIRTDPSSWIAQPANEGATTIAFRKSHTVEGYEDHTVFALRTGCGFEVFPGALTRVRLRNQRTQSFSANWITKDSWVLGSGEPSAFRNIRTRRLSEENVPEHQVTSRVAESFYWLGRYLERAYHLSYLISVVETLETEELNSAEQKLYRPMWNRMLPPLETKNGSSRRSILNRFERYRLLLYPQAGSALTILSRAMDNAESIQECLSPEAWAVLSNLTAAFNRTRFRKEIPGDECLRITRRLSDLATSLIPQFFATAERTMLADDGWHFCEIGEMLERAIITANSVLAIHKAFPHNFDPAAPESRTTELELSAFLRLLGTRDAYRRVFQMRAEPVSVLELLWQNPEAPRSITACLRKCAELLKASSSGDSAATTRALSAVEELLYIIARIDWSAYVDVEPESAFETKSFASPKRKAFGEQDPKPLLERLLENTLEIHTLISDAFLSHQGNVREAVQPKLAGF